ncbi:MAG: hypothetical protein ACLFUJ_15570 [Phycisphaerae bacterium]
MSEPPGARIIRPMPFPLHIVDRDTPRCALDQLARLVGPQQRIISMGPPPEYPALADRFEPVHVPLGLFHMTIRRMRSRLCPPNLIHAWSPTVLSASAAMGKYFESPVVYSLTALPDRLSWALLVKFCEQGLGLIVPTEAHRRALQSKGISSERLWVVPPAACPTDPSGRAELRERLGLEPDELVLTAPGPSIRPANQHAILWAHGMLDAAGMPISIVLTDPGPLLGQLADFRRVTGCRKPPIEAWQVASRPELLAVADLAVFSSPVDAGLWALADTAASGLASVIARTPWATSLLDEDESAARWVDQFVPQPVCAAMLELIESADQRRQLGGRARQIARRELSAEVASQRLAGAWQDLVAAGVKVCA